jgi:putative PIN family toxin of toxin-antitoxin system
MESKYVLDTHVWISIFHGGKNEFLLDALLNNSITLISTAEQEKEFLHVLHYPAVQELLPGKPEGYRAFLKSISIHFPSKKRFALLADYKDNYLVDLAWQSNSILVSDDRGFKSLKLMQRPKITVISKREFYKLLGW